MNRNLSKSVKTVVVSAGISAGTSNQTLTSVDTLGYGAYRIVALLGTLTATQVTSLGVNESSDNSTWTAVTSGGSAIKTANAGDGDAGKTLILEVYKPQKRYIQPQVNRATANAAITSVVVELYLPDFQPVSQDGSVSSYVAYDNPA